MITLLALVVSFWLGNLAGWSLKGDYNTKQARVTYFQMRAKVLDDLAETVLAAKTAADKKESDK